MLSVLLLSRRNLLQAASAPQINAMGEVISRMSMQVRVSEHAQKKVSAVLGRR